MELTTIHLVRHGEVDNPTGILYGRRPGFHLTALGKAMGEKVGEAFSEGHDVRYVASSPLNGPRKRPSRPPMRLICRSRSMIA
nr:histidine phosphatase family protein [Flaviflexus ciconiae]